MLCNDYRHASPPACSESRGVVDVQVDFTGLAIYARIAPHKTGYAGVPHRSAALTSLDPRWGGGGIRAIELSSLNNSSKSMTSCGQVELSLTDHSCLAPYCDLVHERPCRRQLGAATDQRCEQQLESAISRTGAAIATPSAVSTNSSMLDSARIVTLVA